MSEAERHARGRRRDSGHDRITDVASLLYMEQKKTLSRRIVEELATVLLALLTNIYRTVYQNN